MSYNYDKKDATVNTLREGAETVVCAVFPKGLVVADDNTVKHFFHALCNVQSLDSIVMIPESEKEVYGAGKRKKRITSRIRKVDPFNMVINGNAVKTMAAFQQQDIQAKHFVELKGDVENICHLVQFSHDEDTGDLIATDLWMNMTARLLESPGNAEGTTTANIQFYSDDVRVIRIDG